MNEFPEGWQPVRLIDTGTWLSGGTPFTEEPRYWHGETPWISAASLKTFYISDSQRSVTQLGAAAGSRVVPAGTVLFVVRGMSLKNEFRIGVTQRKVAFGQDCKAIIPAPGINPTFLALAIQARTPEILGMVDEAGHGTGRLPTDLISQLRIGIPGPSEQQTIAEFVGAFEEEILSSERLLEKRRLIRKAVLEESFRAVGDSWQSLLLADIITGHGDYGSNVSAYPFDEKLPRYVRITDIDDDGRLSAGDPVSIPRRASRPFMLDSGDLLIARTGFTTGKSYLYQPEDGECAFASYLIRFRIDNEKALPEYVFLWTQSASFSDWINRTVREVGQRNISASEYAQHSILVPPLAEQRSIIERLQGIDSEIREDKAGILKSRSIKYGVTDDLVMGRARIAGLELESARIG